LKICEFTMPEIRYLLAECNFTEDERTLFDMRCVDVPLEECAERMNVSLSTANRLNKRIKQKVEKIYHYC
jgi:DNA-directed RNA polymerase specialized sigma24 family protein